MADILELCRAFAIWGKTLMNELNVMIVGQKWLAEHLLNWCLGQPKIKVIAVSPPNDTDRLAVLANKHKIPVVVHDKVLTDDQVLNDVDIILTTHAYCFVTKEARDKARLGAVGYHPSLLPKYKGKTAVKDAFANGDKVVGGSLYQLDDGWDTGQVLLQQSVAVDDDDTITSLWQGKLAPLGVGLFKEYLSGLLNTI